MRLVKFKNLTLAKTLPYILIAAGIIGLLASFILTLEKIELLREPTTVLSCDINPIVACGSVIQSQQAEAFRFPNPFVGIAGFSVLITIGVALVAGAQYKRWFWLGLQAGCLFGLLFVHWLMFQSIFRLQALCPYCMVVWVATITSFWYVTLHNLRTGHIQVNKRVARFLQKHHGNILGLWFLLIIAVILQRFWYYWSTVL